MNDLNHLSKQRTSCTQQGNIALENEWQLDEQNSPQIGRQHYGISHNNSIEKKIGIVGYWATSISKVRTTVLSEKVIKTDLFPDLDITFRILDIEAFSQYPGTKSSPFPQRWCHFSLFLFF